MLLIFSLYVFCVVEDVVKADAASSEAAATPEARAKWNYKSPTSSL